MRRSLEAARKMESGGGNGGGLGLEESGEKFRLLTALFHSDIVTREN